MKGFKTTQMILLLLILASCGPDDEGPLSGNNGNNISWSISLDQVFDGGPGKDGIPALTIPEFITPGEASHLSDDDLILGYKVADDIRAYPHSILDWHEIINDEVGGLAVAVTYCPLTGTGIGWERTIDGVETTFGVSGLLYNSNLIPYDRLTDSNWSQIRLDCVNGELKGTEAKTFPLVETTWKTWKEMYPDTEVVSTNTGHNRNYGHYPYGDYRTNHNNIIFPYTPKDERLDSKERVHGVIVEGKAKAYRFSSFPDDLTVIQDEFEGVPIVIAGSASQNFIVSFERTLHDGTLLEFSQAMDSSSANILIDNEGNTWNIFGEAVLGSRGGTKLRPTTSFIGYWFSWGAFYPGLKIYTN